MHVKYFGQFLLEKKYISKEQLVESVKHQKQVNKKIGLLAIDKQFMTAAQVRDVLETQKTENQPFGEIAVSKNYMKKEQLYELLTIQKSDRIFLGEALLDKRILTLEQLESYLKEYKKSQENISEITKDFHTIDRKYSLVVQDSTHIFLNMLVRLIDETGKIAGCLRKLPPELAAASNYFVYQKIFGGKNCIIGIIIDKPAIIFFADKMFQQPITELNEIAEDGIKEFVNIAIGHICSALSNDGFQTETTPPQLVPLAEFSGELTGAEEFIIPIRMASHMFYIYFVIS